MSFLQTPMHETQFRAANRDPRFWHYGIAGSRCNTCSGPTKKSARAGLFFGSTDRGHITLTQLHLPPTCRPRRSHAGSKTPCGQQSTAMTVLCRMQKFFYLEARRLLKLRNRSQDFLRQAPLWAWCGRRRMSGALLVPMLLNGGCGYEDLRLFPSVAIQRWLRSAV
jgi:hypothetical protein